MAARVSERLFALMYAERPSRERKTGIIKGVTFVYICSSKLLTTLAVVFGLKVTETLIQRNLWLLFLLTAFMQITTSTTYCTVM